MRARRARALFRPSSVHRPRARAADRWIASLDANEAIGPLAAPRRSSWRRVATTLLLLLRQLLLLPLLCPPAPPRSPRASTYTTGGGAGVWFRARACLPGRRCGEEGGQLRHRQGRAGRPEANTGRVLPRAPPSLLRAWAPRIGDLGCHEAACKAGGLPGIPTTELCGPPAAAACLGLGGARGAMACSQVDLPAAAPAAQGSYSP